MNKDQEECLAYGFFLLVMRSDRIKDSEKAVFREDYDSVFEKIGEVEDGE